MTPPLPRTSPYTGEGWLRQAAKQGPTALQEDLPRWTGIHPHPTHGEGTLFPGTPLANAARLTAHRISLVMVCRQPLELTLRSSSQPEMITLDLLPAKANAARENRNPCRAARPRRCLREMNQESDSTLFRRDRVPAEPELGNAGCVLHNARGEDGAYGEASNSASERPRSWDRPR